MQTGKWPTQVDHENHNTLDNRWKNLRNVSRKINGKNKSLLSNNVSGRVGVAWLERRRKWVAQIGVNGKKIYLGSYDNFEAAVGARQNAEQKYGFHSNHGRTRFCVAV